MPFPGVAVEEETPEEVRLRLAMNREGWPSNSRSRSRLVGLFWRWRQRASLPETGRVFSTSPACRPPVSSRRPIRGSRERFFQAEGFAYANCMGVPLLAGDPRGHDGHVLALGFPLSVNYRDLFFHTDTETRRITAGIGEGISRPAATPAEEKAEDAPATPPKRGLPMDPARARSPSRLPAAAPLASLPYRAGVVPAAPARLGVEGQYRNLAGEWMKSTGLSSTIPKFARCLIRWQCTLGVSEGRGALHRWQRLPDELRALHSRSWPGYRGHPPLWERRVATALYRCWIRYREEWI